MKFLNFGLKVSDSENRFILAALFFYEILMFFSLNPLYMGNPYTSTFKNSEDPDEMPHNVTFHQGLHCIMQYFIRVYTVC